MAWACRAAAIADAFTTWLNDPARDWTGRFVARRTWAPDTDFADLDVELAVDVVAILEGADELISRATKQQDYTTLVVFRQRYTPDSGPADDAGIPNGFADALCGFVESVNDQTVDVELNATGFRVFRLKGEVDLSFVGMALKEKRSFLAFLEITWRELRAR